MDEEEQWWGIAFSFMNKTKYTRRKRESESRTKNEIVVQKVSADANNWLIPGRRWDGVDIYMYINSSEKTA